MKFKKLLRKIVPPLAYDAAFLFKKKIPEDKEAGSKFYCPVCSNYISDFGRIPDFLIEQWDKYNYVHSVFQGETFNFLKYSCPLCGSSDRNRLYALFLNKKFEEYSMNKTLNFLDIAPEKALADLIRSFKFINYRSLDLYMEGVDDRSDITEMNIYESEKFDIILCSHVLEHIDDDRKAISELFRILKTDGFAIIMVPILMSLQNDLENPEWKSEEERWKYYGQNDHVRMYSKKGFLSKLEYAGFKVFQYDKTYFGKDIFQRHGINEKSVLYIVRK